MMHTIKHPPVMVRQYFQCRYAEPEYSFDFYWYGSKEDRTYGCLVSKNGKLWSYMEQATLDGFASMRPNEPFMPCTKKNSHFDPLGLKVPCQ